MRLTLTRRSASVELRFVAAQGAPAEHAAEPFDAIAERDASAVDRKRKEPLLVLALPHLQHVEAAPKLRLDLDVSEEEDVVEDEGEPAQVSAAAEGRHLVREDRGAARRADEPSE